MLGGLDKVFAGPRVLLRREAGGRTGNGRSVSVQLSAMSEGSYEQAGLGERRARSREDQAAARADSLREWKARRASARADVDSLRP